MYNRQLAIAHVVDHYHVACHERPAGLVDSHLGHADDLVDDVHHVHDLLLNGLRLLALDLDLLRLGHLHDVRDEVKQSDRATFDHVQLAFLQRVRGRLEHGPAEAHDAVQGTPQLVPKNRGDLRLPLVHCLHRRHLRQVLADRRDRAVWAATELHDEGQQHLHGAAVAFGVAQGDLHGARAESAAASVDGGAQAGSGSLGDEVKDAGAHGRLHLDAGDAGEVLVPRDDDPLGTHREDRCARAAEEAAHVLFPDFDLVLQRSTPFHKILPIPYHHERGCLEDFQQHVPNGVEELLRPGAYATGDAN
mmetsp:Transcript_114218/g.329957  ORF Transcript_114218/g.329957 Transcript_114218/m.329957 type:complete len:305 (+) Transcript_114218:988-1902(+)